MKKKEAMKILKDYYDKSALFSIRTALDTVIPELKESEDSEDDRIRKELIEFIKSCGAYSQEYIDWLEKQGNLVKYYENKLDKCACDNFNKGYKKALEKQGEQKHVDKVKPKFKVGDKIQYLKGCGTIMTIEKIENGEYIFGNNMGHTTIESGNKWHLVDIIEQKSAEWHREDEQNLNACLGHIPDEFLRRWLTDIIHVKYDKHNDKVKPKFKIGDTVKDPYGDLYHITEITDDSYKTDDGRFILFKNQEVYTLSNFTAWSEEDEAKLKSILFHIEDVENKDVINWFKSLKDRVQSQPKQEWSEEDNKMIIKICQNLYDYPRIKSPFDDESFNEAQKEVQFIKSLRPQNNITDEELAQAKKNAYNDVLDKIEYHSGDPTFDDGWSAAIWYLKKRNTIPQSQWKPSDKQLH